MKAGLPPRSFRALGLLATISSCALPACLGQTRDRRLEPQAAYDGKMIPAASPQVTHIGRFAKTKDGMRFAWSGSTSLIRFSGTQVAVDITDSGENQYLVIIDGRPLRQKILPPKGRSQTELVRGLPRGEHTVALYRLTEPLLGETEVHGFLLDEYAEVLPPPARKERRILIIGDSISTGYGIEGKSPECEFSADTENHYLSYGARAARALDAELTTIAWSGRGVFSNRGSTTETETMPQLFERVLPEAPDLHHDFAAEPEPGVVLVNLGTNDFAPEVPNTAPFLESYRDFARKLRQMYPRAELVLTLGPMLVDGYPDGKNSYSEAKAAIQKVFADLRGAGDGRTHFLEFPVAPQAEGHGCNYHPSDATQKRMASELVAKLRKILAW